MRAEFAALLAQGDAAALRRAWRQVAPHLPQPTTDAEAEIIMHHARTQARSVPMRARAWSHRWLLERGLPSGLPDILRPRAERLYPRVVEAVGISSMLVTPVTGPLRAVMTEQVEDAYATHRILRLPASERADIVRGRMREARAKERKRLMG